MDAAPVVDRGVMPAGATKADAQSRCEGLAGVPDGRKRRAKRRPAALMSPLLLLAKMSGEEKLRGVAQWARRRIDWVQAHPPLKR